MFESYLVGVGVTVGVVVVWVGVQNVWRAAFADVDPTSDVLSGRCQCDSRPCGEICGHDSHEED